MDPDERGTRFALVLLCTGNRFRSPIAEGLIRTYTAGIPLDASSLGLADLGPVPPLPEALEEAERISLDIAGHRAKPLHGQDLRRADLVLGFERIHVAKAVVEANARRERTFTLPELVGLVDGLEVPADGDPVARARRTVALADQRRRAEPEAPLLPELGDPWGGPPELYRETAERVVDLCVQLVPILFGVTPSRAAPGRGSRRGLSRGR
jgi:protein-tyrosine phosphatase